MIENEQQLQELCKQLSHEETIAIDTEFIRENTFFPIIALIQVASKNNAWLIDVKKFDKKTITPLLKLLQNKDVLKIFHAAQADQECFFSSYKVITSPSFDTAEAASLLGIGTSIGLQSLLKKVLRIDIKKGHSRCDWLKRPLPKELQTYALNDVAHLVLLAEKLSEELKEKQRYDLALQHSAKWENPKKYQADPETLAKKRALSGKVDRRGYAILKELFVWRENRIRELDIPRRRLAADTVLVDLARARPNTLEQLSGFRGLNKGELQKQGRLILDVIKQAQTIAEKDLPVLPKRNSTNKADPLFNDFFNFAVKTLAKEHKIAAHHLIASDNSLTPEGKRLIGKEISELLAGTKSLAIKDGKVTLV